MNHKEILQEMKQSTWQGGSFDLKAMERCLDHLEHPEMGHQYVHITGTNGKGSVSALLYEILQESGYKIGFFSSPAITGFSEQIQYNKEKISSEEIEKYGQKVLDISKIMGIEGGSAPSEFEMTFAIALLFFQEKKPDLIIVEVGLGGRLDATNVIPSPKVAVMTSIGMDHCNILGDNLSAITKEKAGIFKKNSKVALYRQGEEVTQMVRSICDELELPLSISCPDDCTILSQSLEGQVIQRKEMDFHLKLLGNHQKENFALVLTVLQLLEEDGFVCPWSWIQRACEKVEWPCRLEVISKNPPLILDGAHNPEGILALENALESLFPGKSIVFVLGMLADKDYDTMLSQLEPLAKKFITLTTPNPRGLTAQGLKDLIPTDKEVIAMNEISDFVRFYQNLELSDDVYCAVGSLYMVGTLRNLLFNEENE